jgi:hypothetical protein
MRELFELSESEGFRAIRRAALNEWKAHGVGLAWDERYAVMARLADVDEKLAEEAVHDLRDYYDYFGREVPSVSFVLDIFWAYRPRLYLGVPEARDALLNPSDPVRRSGFVDNLPLDDPPFVVRVSVEPQAAADPDQIRDNLNGLASDFGDFRVEVEVEPIPQLLATAVGSNAITGGDKVNNLTTNGTGTAGSIVERQSDGALFVTTAGHVADQGDPVGVRDDLRGKGQLNAGVCARSEIGAAIAGQLTDGDVDALPEVDFGLVELDEPIPTSTEVDGVGAISSVMPKADLPAFSLVTTSGSRSGLQQLRVEDLRVPATLRHNGQLFGYKNILRLTRQSRFWQVTGLFIRPARPGDSGGWVIRESDNRPEWAGVVIGGEGPSGYACSAELAATACDVDVC